MRDVKGFEGLYKVDKKGNVYSVRNDKFLSPILMPSGYLCAHLCNGKRTKLAKVHRIVAEAYIPNPQKDPQVNHKDGNKQNNCVENLEWCDGFYNMRHAKSQGLFRPCGEDNPSAKLTWRIVEQIRNEYKRGSREYGTAALGRKYGVTKVMIGKIVRNECWVHGFSAEQSINRAEGDI